MDSNIPNYVQSENIARYRRLIAVSENDPARNEARHQTLLRLLDEEKAKGEAPTLIITKIERNELSAKLD
jgi:hypothetical protein